MKNQASFSLKDRRKKLKCCLLQFLFVALRVKWYMGYIYLQSEAPRVVFPAQLQCSPACVIYRIS